MNQSKGFTLIELMTVVVIVAILAAIAIPGYQQYMRKKDLALAQQEIKNIAMELDRHRLKNFSYTGFSVSDVYPTGNKNGTVDGTDILVPASNSKYRLQTTVTDSGSKWTIIATRIDTTKQAKNYDLLMNNEGVRCMTRTTNTITTSSNNCGTDSEVW